MLLNVRESLSVDLLGASSPVYRPSLSTYRLGRSPAKMVLEFGLPLVLGLAFYCSADPSMSAFAISASMTVVGFMAGFLMNLMLSVGRVDTLGGTDYETSVLLVERLRQLLRSLTLNFLSYIATLAVGIVLLVKIASDSAGQPAAATPAVQILTAIFATGLLVTFIRSSFLPLQIVELHRFQFDAFLKSKQISRR